MTDRIEVFVPDIGDVEDADVIELLVKPGDPVQAEQALVTVETDKASMEIPSSHAGTVKELHLKLGDKVSRGVLMAVLEAVSGPSDGAQGAPSVPAASATVVAPPPAVCVPALPAAPQRPAPAPSGALPHASPSIRRYARELDVPLELVTGSAAKGRITRADVQGFVRHAMASPASAGATPRGSGFPDLLPWPQVDFAKFGPVELRERNRVRKISGANLHRNWVQIPHVTNHEDADITGLEAFRVEVNREHGKSGVKVTLLAFLVKAAEVALRKFPEFNASLDDGALVLKRYFHIGFAVDTPNGLMVPVIKDVDRKGLLQIAQEMADLATRAREGKLGPGDMSGGCFSISSLGGIGGRYFTPIINAPEVAIMGVGRSTMEPRWDGSQFAPRLVLPLSLSWDHRVIDGAMAGRFNACFASLLADFRRIVL